jgi:UrcA family protein
MTTLLKTICVAAGVSMAALAATGAASSAQAEDRSIHIQVNDLNLSTPQGRAAFDFRVSRAARQLCEDRGDLRSNMACRRAVQDEATESLNQLARRDGVNLAAARR